MDALPGVELFAKFLRDAGCGPMPPGDLIDVVFRGATADIYAKMSTGWFWWSGKDWRAAPHGPPYPYKP